MRHVSLGFENQTPILHTHQKIDTFGFSNLRTIVSKLAKQRQDRTHSLLGTFWFVDFCKKNLKNTVFKNINKGGRGDLLTNVNKGVY